MSLYHLAVYLSTYLPVHTTLLVYLSSHIPLSIYLTLTHTFDSNFFNCNGSHHLLHLRLNLCMALLHRCFRIGFAARDSAHKISHQSRQPTPPRSRATSDADVRRPPRDSRLTKSKQRGFFEAERDRIEKQGGSR